MARDLSEVRKNLYKRYRDSSRRVANFSAAELAVDRIEKVVFGFLTEFGVDFPIDFLVPPPDVEVAARQGTVSLGPQGTQYGSSPPVKTDTSCTTFRARDSGFLVIDFHDIIMEDPIAEEYFEITYTFDEQENNPNFQRTKGTGEDGHWKFNRIVLVDGEELEICVVNTNPYAGGVYSFESRMWML